MDPELEASVENFVAAVREMFCSDDVRGYALLRQTFAERTGGRYALGLSPDASVAFRIFHKRSEYFEKTGRLYSPDRTKLTDATFAEEWLKDYTQIQRYGVKGKISWSPLTEPDGLAFGLLDNDRAPLTEGSEASSALIADIRFVSHRMKTELARQPNLLYQLDGRQFEEVVAELLHDRGYSIHLSPKGPDGGVDIYAAQRNGLGSFLYLVQCKKYAADRPVALDVVQRLYGRVAADQATAGLLVTTSRFTQPARTFAEQVRYQLSLREFEDLDHWLSIWR